MSRQPVSARGRLALAGAIAVLGALGVVLFRDADGGATSPAPSLGVAPARSAGPAETPADTALTGPVRDPSAGQGEAESEDEDLEEAAEPRPPRRERYTAAFNRKIGRIRARITGDCGEPEWLVHLFDDYGAVRDRIIESAVATDSGQKTKEEQRAFERAQLRELEEKVCRTAAGLPLTPECKRHFHACERAL